MAKISILGVSSSGKTCFIYAMSQLLRCGVSSGDNLLQMISNNSSQQIKLNNGYLKLIQNRWPQTSDKTELYDFRVSVRCNGYFNEIISSLEIQDYRGGMLLGDSPTDTDELDTLMDSFRGSSAIIFIIDGQTLIEALDPSERDASHRNCGDITQQFISRSQIELAENIFMKYSKAEEYIPPVIFAISKGDLFASKNEEECAMRLIREKIPSIFSIGSGMTAAIVRMSLGENLGTDSEGGLTGQLNLSEENNIHVPVIFGIYSDLCIEYENSSDSRERDGIMSVLDMMRRFFADRIRLFVSGKEAIEL